MLGLLVDPVLDCGVCSFEFLDVDKDVLFGGILFQVEHYLG